MLVDVTRRPVRLIYEECPSVLVVRTMSTRRANGCVHRENGKDDFGYPKPKRALQPAVTVPNNGVSYFETILHPRSDQETYTVSGYTDQFAKTQGIWRINLIIETLRSGVRLLTILDETNSHNLCTVHLPELENPEAGVFDVTTPLRRFLQQNTNESKPGLWGALLDEF